MFCYGSDSGSDYGSDYGSSLLLEPVKKQDHYNQHSCERGACGCEFDTIVVYDKIEVMSHQNTSISFYCDSCSQPIDVSTPDGWKQHPCLRKNGKARKILTRCTECNMSIDTSGDGMQSILNHRCPKKYIGTLYCIDCGQISVGDTQILTHDNIPVSPRELLIEGCNFGFYMLNEGKFGGE